MERYQVRDDRPPGSSKYYHQLIASDATGDLGYLTYEYDPSENVYHLEDVQLYSNAPHRRGIGSKLIADFAQRVGPGKHFFGAITHDESFDKVTQQYGNQVLPTQPFPVPVADLPNIPIVHVLERGNVRVDSMTISRISDPNFPDIHFEVLVFGVTK